MHPVHPDSNIPRLGMCCNCGRDDDTVIHVLPLDLRSPEAGAGCWGCAVCGLPPAGAVAVLCDGCMKKREKPKFAVLGNPWNNRRIPCEQLTEPYDHIEAKHEEAGTITEAEVEEFAAHVADTIVDSIIDMILGPGAMKKMQERQQLVNRHLRN